MTADAATNAFTLRTLTTCGSGDFVNVHDKLSRN